MNYIYTYVWAQDGHATIVGAMFTRGTQHAHTLNTLVTPIINEVRQVPFHSVGL